jgi:hypothetical protein
MAEKEHEPIIAIKAEPGDKVNISVLGNAVYYFFQRVFIITEKKDFRLIVIKKGKLLVDATYKTSKGAKIAFLKLFRDQVAKAGVKPSWTDFYTPEEPWIKKRFKFA